MVSNPSTPANNPANELDTASMSNQVINSPVIFTGRGGSGTRLLTALAADFDIFLGNELNKTGDSTEWADLIYKLATHKVPSSDKPQVDQEAIKDSLQNNARLILGKGNWLPTQHWGWKLPESMLVLPVLLETFKHLKLVHLVRHPVTSSIRRTHRTSRSINPVGKAVLTSAYGSAGIDPLQIDSDPDYWRNAITWLYQVNTVHRLARNSLPPNRYLQLRYEDICTDSGSAHQKLCNFLNKQITEPNPGKCTVAIDSKRTSKIDMKDQRSIKVWNLCGKLALELGYSPSGVLQ